MFSIELGAVTVDVYRLPATPGRLCILILKRPTFHLLVLPMYGGQEFGKVQRSNLHDLHMPRSLDITSETIVCSYMICLFRDALLQIEGDFHVYASQ